MQEHNEEPDAIKAASVTEVVAVLVGDVIEKLFSRIAKQPTGIVQPQPVTYGQSYNPYALPGNGAQLAAGLLAYPQMGHQPAMSAYTGQLQAGFDQAGFNQAKFNPMLAQMHSMAAFNLGGNLGRDRFRQAQQNFVPGRKTASGAMVEKKQEICNKFLTGNCTYGAKCRYVHPEPAAATK